MRAFLADMDVAKLGEILGVLTEFNGSYYATPVIGAPPPATAWQQVEIHPVEVKHEPDKAFAWMASGIDGVAADFKGILLGVGALGSALAALWSREAWGEWAYIDPDTLEPHNLVRHQAKNCQIGRYKVDAMKEIVEADFHPSYRTTTAIVDSGLNRTNRAVKEALVGAAILVDCTTTLEVPRDISQLEDTPRSVSVFLTPSAGSSVALMESANRGVRLDSLEAQYYRAILNSEWGSDHLSGHKGAVWVGAGCRDVSAIVSNESVELHAAIIAGQVRTLRDQSEARIKVWRHDPKSGGVHSEEVVVEETIRSCCGEWTVVLDSGSSGRLRVLRNRHLPEETGGIVLGYVDQKLKTIFVVDVLPAPKDSEAERSGFTRGVDGLAAILKEAARRTANIVGYIGEWHSHPSFCPAYPSELDRTLIRTLATTLSQEGQPALMIIVGTSGEVSVTVKYLSS